MQDLHAREGRSVCKMTRRHLETGQAREEGALTRACRTTRPEHSRKLL